MSATNWNLIRKEISTPEKFVEYFTKMASDTVDRKDRDRLQNTDSSQNTGGPQQSNQNNKIEIPNGTINGVNGIFILEDIPLSNTLKLYLNGLLLGNTIDYTYLNSVITMTTIPYSGDALIADYQY